MKILKLLRVLKSYLGFEMVLKKFMVFRGLRVLRSFMLYVTMYLQFG